MKKVIIYTGALCVFCDRAKELLNKKKIHFEEIYIADKPEKMSEMIKKANGRRTVPQIFIGDTHIGGYRELQSFEREGKLDSILNT